MRRWDRLLDRSAGGFRDHAVAADEGDGLKRRHLVNLRRVPGGPGQQSPIPSLLGLALGGQQVGVVVQAGLAGVVETQGVPVEPLRPFNVP